MVVECSPGYLVTDWDGAGIRRLLKTNLSRGGIGHLTMDEVALLLYLHVTTEVERSINSYLRCAAKTRLFTLRLLRVELTMNIANKLKLPLAYSIIIKTLRKI